MKREQLQKLLENVSRTRIIVIGDFCLDAYWFIDESASEISIETGEPTHPVCRQKYSLGGAGNVAANLAAMGVGEVLAFGVTGHDPFGNQMLEIMRTLGINSGHMLFQDSEWQTHTYSKPYTGDKELGRIDFGNFNKLYDSTADLLLSDFESSLLSADAVIINQQVPSGIHTDYFREKLVRLIARHPEKIIIADSRNYNDQFGAAIRKMNDTEAARLCGADKSPDDKMPFSEVSKYAESLFAGSGKPLFITRGSRGSLVCDSSGIKEIPGLMIISRVDTVGAGDSYLSGVAAALAAGCGLEEAATLGTYVAGVTVQKLFQTGTASPAEILQAGTDPDLVYSPDLAENEHNAHYLEGSEIEIISWPERGRRFNHVIFDHDGTISTLREGWENVMAPMMVREILGDRFTGEDDSLHRTVRARVDDFIDKTTGVQTLVQMAGLASIVKEYGFVPAGRILDEHGYKRIYNTELMKVVDARTGKLGRKELGISDLTIKGAVAFLKALHDRGVLLYLASGTDTSDVQREAEILGYADLFGGRIFGAVGDINTEAKKVVLDKILGSIGGATAGGVLTFGDGPVEVRETVKRGGFAIGVASNELRRYGLNQRKRSRLIKAGAGLVIPDFSGYVQILDLLNMQ
ncbi:MAG: PfkB family carbohydrate kinase [Bacteroidales bacterium]|jgi:rfaE bifunctional protein kinase chain/domain|nr:PfkB family carbohydrate kinase [Bacteroidales bacterium]